MKSTVWGSKPWRHPIASSVDLQAQRGASCSEKARLAIGRTRESQCGSPRLGRATSCDQMLSIVRVRAERKKPFGWPAQGAARLPFELVSDQDRAFLEASQARAVARSGLKMKYKRDSRLGIEGNEETGVELSPARSLSCETGVGCQCPLEEMRLVISLRNQVMPPHVEDGAVPSWASLRTWLAGVVWIGCVVCTSAIGASSIWIPETRGTSNVK